MPRMAAIGECMIELSRDRACDSKQYRLGYGGDTLNVVLYFARWGGRADYVTLLGDDPFSRDMVADWQAENIGVSLVRTIPNRQPGLYIIETDERGERRFTYWRDRSPAQEIFELDGCADLLKNLTPFDYIYFSGITLSLFSQKSLDIFWDFLTRYKQAGGKVICDLNYRSAGWKSREYAQDIIMRFISLTDIALPGLDDEHGLYGACTIAQTMERYQKFGVPEVVLKCGEKGCVIWYENQMKEMTTDSIQNPLDTTAAGDGFNGGYLAARLAGIPPEEAVIYGQKTASLIVQYPGAIVPKSNWPADYTMGND